MNLLKIAMEAAQKGGRAALSFFEKEHSYRHKGHLSNFATEADLASEKAIFEIIRKKFPDHNFLSEEMGLVDKNGEYTWVVDPIDGTIAFSHRLPLWGVSIAVFKNNDPVIGVINMPIFKDFYYAQKGNGTYRDGKKVSVSKEKILEKSLITFEVSYPNYRRKQTFPFAPFFKKFPSPFLSSICTVFDLVTVADGRTEGLYEETPLIWDIAAGALMVEEAGGKITDWKNKKIKWEGKNPDKHYQIIASNGILHDELVERLNGYLVY